MTSRGSAVLAVGFGTTVAMWAVGYFARLPAIVLPSPALLVLMLICLFAGGLLVGRQTEGRWRAGAAAGLISGALNLLVLGSLLAGDRPNEVVPSALWWVPGSILLSGLLAAVGAEVGSHWPSGERGIRDWTTVYVRVAIAATLLLLAVGGLVTSAEAGLAVSDWPTSFGYNMFLYPLSRMTGGVYYEHAHRLFGALVGLTTLVLAVVLQRRETRRWVRVLGWFALALVIAQGVLGGIRVSGRSLGLAMVHGVLGQLFFGVLVALGVFTSVAWRRGDEPLERRGVGTDRWVGGVLLGLLLVQLVLGAAQRHFHDLLMIHVIFGVAVVVPLAVNVGLRAWGLNRGQPLLQRLGLLLLAATCLQVLLGLGAYVVTGLSQTHAVSRALDLGLATAHQWFGAILLATAVSLVCFEYRLLRDPQQTNAR